MQKFPKQEFVKKKTKFHKKKKKYSKEKWVKFSNLAKI